MRGERRAGFRTCSRQVVQHAGGKARVGEALHDEADCKRRLVRRLRDQRAAGRQRRPELPGVDVDRVVPGRDGADDADRGRDDEASNVLARRRPDAPADSPPFLCIVADDFDAEADFLFRVWDRLPLLPGQELGDGRQTLDNQIGGAMQNAGARVGVRRGPARQRALGRCDGGVDVGAVGERGRTDAFAGRWIVDGEPATAVSRPPAPVDEEIALAHGLVLLSAPSADARVPRSCGRSRRWLLPCRRCSG